ncbi:hypothetical protein [Clostridium sp. C8-1-8]|uniref:hypothetical protein n=1 Tax=Clostridium sp. C8-1-8 TaxID=2698831 RepID=UPI00136A5D16|nr:hypothetical protein [Clostridium sp. C8-1-8]
MREFKNNKFNMKWYINNNSATANVLEKLEKYDVYFIAAYLGKVTIERSSL